MEARKANRRIPVGIKNQINQENGRKHLERKLNTSIKIIKKKILKKKMMKMMMVMVRRRRREKKKRRNAR